MISLIKMNLSAQMVLSGVKRSITVSCMSMKLDEKYKNIGFIGAGNMAKAIMQGLIHKEKFLPEQIYVLDRDEKYMEHLKANDAFFQANKIKFSKNMDIFSQVRELILCVKPQDTKTVLETYSKFLTKDHLLISIATGIRLEKIEKCLNNPVPVVRITTNTAALIQEGCSMYSLGKYASHDDALFVNKLLKSIGTSEGEIKESLMDVVTALSGSGPAYMFLILESLADGAERMGLDKDTAIRLASQTMLGASSMVMEELNDKENGKHIMQMKEEVCSPGGTTINGIAQLEKYRVRSALINCIEQATKRAVQLNLN